ncbi:TIGR04561 family membrane protein [Spiroplasma endosymbiont of Othius punctulatus]|uniref:TIGR04561 family membrane protein n=1 Tax=Spiroplasma endosymbiont of Othius punctulatus TaxID=3066289 RepID=UPI0030CF7C3C
MKTNSAIFEILDLKIPLWVFIIIFIIIGLLAVAIYLFSLFKSKKEIIYNNKKISVHEYEQMKTMNLQKENFEMEISKVISIVNKN